MDTMSLIVALAVSLNCEIQIDFGGVPAQDSGLWIDVWLDEWCIPGDKHAICANVYKTDSNKQR